MQRQWLPRQMPCSDKLTRRKSRRSPENDRAQFEDTWVRSNLAQSTSPVNPSQTVSPHMSQTRATHFRDASERSLYQDAETELPARLGDLCSNHALGEHVQAQP